jgi:hypothetical protein
MLPSTSERLCAQCYSSPRRLLKIKWPHEKPAHVCPTCALLLDLTVATARRAIPHRHQQDVQPRY